MTSRQMLIIKIVSSVLLLIFLTALFLLYVHESLVERGLEVDRNEKSAVPKRVSFTENSIDNIRLLTFNVWGLPIWVPKIDKLKRYKHIPDSIISTNPDIVCLQEAFDPKIRLSIIRKMQYEGYYFNNDYTCNKNTFLFIKKDCFGGLMTFSKYPEKWEAFYPHKIQKGMKQDEKKGLKGILISSIESPWGEIIIVNIHLYSGRLEKDEEIRLNQVRRLKEIIDSLSIGDKKIIIQGDLNIIHPFIINNNINNEVYSRSKVYEFLIDTLKFVDTKSVITEDDITYDGLNNRYASTFYNKFEKRQKFDYCLYRFPLENISSTSGKTVFKAPWPLSDHYGVLSVIELVNK